MADKKREIFLKGEYFKEQRRNVKREEERAASAICEPTAIPPLVLSDGWVRWTRENTRMDEKRPLTILPRSHLKPMTPMQFAMRNTRQREMGNDLVCHGLDRDLPRQQRKVKVDLELAAVGARDRQMYDEGNYRWASRTPNDPLPAYVATTSMGRSGLESASKTANKCSRHLKNKRYRNALQSTLDDYINQQASSGLELDALDPSAHHRYVAMAALPRHLSSSAQHDPRDDDFPRLYNATPPPTFCHQLGNPGFLKCDDLHRFCGCRERSRATEVGRSFLGLRPATVPEHPLNARNLTAMSDGSTKAGMYTYNADVKSAKQMASFFRSIR